MQDWYRKFRIQDESFVNPAFIREGGKPRLPPFLEHDLDAKEAILTHAKEHLHELSGEFLHSYIHEEVLPETAKKRTQELRDEMENNNDWDREQQPINEIKVTVEQLL